MVHVRETLIHCLCKETDMESRGNGEKRGANYLPMYIAFLTISSFMSREDDFYALFILMAIFGSGIYDLGCRNEKDGKLFHWIVISCIYGAIMVWQAYVRQMWVIAILSAVYLLIMVCILYKWYLSPPK